MERDEIDKEINAALGLNKTVGLIDPRELELLRDDLGAELFTKVDEMLFSKNLVVSRNGKEEKVPNIIEMYPDNTGRPLFMNQELKTFMEYHGIYQVLPVPKKPSFTRRFLGDNRIVPQ